jgi:HSP20 family molecular chaperone IbpA
MKETTLPEKRADSVPATRENTRTLTPDVDIFEAPDGLAVIADMPGVDKNDVDIHVENNVLTISGKVTSTTPGDPLSHEFQLANYFRQFQLSEQVDRDKIRAELKAGVLSIHLPKVEKAEPKKIAVTLTS